MKDVLAFVCAALTVSAPFGISQDEGEGIQDYGLGAVFPQRELVINEVSPGPALSYIEIFNGKGVGVDLAGYSLETETGSLP